VLYYLDYIKNSCVSSLSDFESC